MAQLYNVAALHIAPRTSQLFELFEMTDYGDDLIESYSHGMKQRLVMAGALIHKPAALIVDEPMVGLDPRGIASGQAAFPRALHRRSNGFHVDAYP